MLKLKSTKISTLLIVVGLMIFPVFLAACDSDASAAAAPIGLRMEAVDDLAGVGIDDTSEASDATAVDLADAPVEANIAMPANAGATARNGNNNQARVADRSERVFDPETAAELTTVEIEGLTYMREEEKLARDVYLALYDQWGMAVFQNIAGSEQAHMDSILMLLDQYELADPAAGKDAGEFTNPLFQSLYEQLVGQGAVSLVDALKVGATIEELDIVDLEALLAETDNEYIIQVYNNLLAGSENHLRAFVTNLERQTGEAYQPVYLDQDVYQAIMDDYSSHGVGNDGNGGGNGGRGNGRSGNGKSGNGRPSGQDSNI